MRWEEGWLHVSPCDVAWRTLLRFRRTVDTEGIGHGDDDELDV
jgi:hypothetical protein